MEPISPELCLVDPVLARRARELLPPLEDVEPALSSAPATTFRVEAPSRGRLTRLGGWLLVASVALNVALLWPKSTSGTRPTVSPDPAPTAARSPAEPAKRPTPKRTGGVLAAKAEARRSAPSAKPHVVRGRRVLSWRATPRAGLYDLVLWRGHERVADLWATKSKITVATIACGAGKRLSKGRYLWFVYPVVDRAAHRYGALAGWGAVDIDPKAERCFGT